MEIEILNWDKYNPRKDLKKTSWYRFENSFFENDQFYDFTDAELLCVVYIFCQASKKSGAMFRINLAHAHRIGRREKADLLSTIGKLEQLQILRVSGQIRTDPLPTIRNETNGTIRTERNVTERTPVRATKVPSGTPYGDERIPVRTSEKTRFLISTYCESWKSKYGSNPDIVGKDAGIAKRLAKDLSKKRISELLEAFFSMPDSWLVKRRHPLELFESKLKEITSFATNGKFVTQSEMRSMDQGVAVVSQLDRIRKGDL